MNIFDNLIKDTEIIGISDLIATESKTQMPGGIYYPTVEYSFRVFLKNTFITIYSPAFTDKKTQQDAWLKKYLQVKEKIKQQIGELEPNS